MPLIPNGDHVPAQDEVAHLLGWTPVLEYKSDRGASWLEDGGL